MDHALIIGSSGGIGAALVTELSARGTKVTALSRSEHGLDLCDETSVKRILSGLEGPFDLILVATGALEIGGNGPEKTLKTLRSDALMDQFKLNAIGPALVLKHAAHLLSKNRRAVFAALSARVGSIGDNALGGWYSYRAAKAALNQLIHTSAIEIARSHPEAVVVALHPGTVTTPLTQKYLGKHPAVAPPEAARNLLSVIEDLISEQSGGFFDWEGKAVPW